MLWLIMTILLFGAFFASWHYDRQERLQKIELNRKIREELERSSVCLADPEVWPGPGDEKKGAIE